MSVLIPARNAEGTIAETLASLSPLRDLIGEIIVTDDGGSEPLEALVRQAGEYLEVPVKIVPGPETGPGAARNAALDRAQCDYVYFLDADDLTLADGFRQLHALLTYDRAVTLVVGACIDRRPTGDSLYGPGRYHRAPELNIRDYISGRIPMIRVGGALARRSLIADLRFPETSRRGEDTIFWLSVLTRAAVRTVPEPAMIYRISLDRYRDRVMASPRAAYLSFARDARTLTACGIDRDLRRLLRGVDAVTIMRILRQNRDFAAASRFLKLARRAHARLRYSPRVMAAGLKLAYLRLRHANGHRPAAGPELQSPLPRDAEPTAGL